MLKGKKWAPILCFGLLMLALGSSDALRGIFAPVFQQRYALSDTQLSTVVAVSYAGNLLFLSVGGKLLDTFPRKKVTLAVTGIWAAAAVLNLVTDNYYGILVSMFLALGASTLLNTTINILTPALFAGSAGLMVNVLFFMQGIGTSSSQFILGRYAFSYAGWKGINLVLLLVGAATLLLLLGMAVPQPASAAGPAAAAAQRPEPGRKILLVFAAMMGCYFIGEHGIMNWLMSYCISAFSMSSAEASVSLSVFWFGMTAGRLLFAPVVQKLGTAKSLSIFGAVGTVMFCAGCLLGRGGIWVLGASGFALSILYPTMVLLIQKIYPPATAATRTGAIISIATIADIVFNLLFGMAADAWGYRVSFMVVPVCMAGFYLLYRLLLRQVRAGQPETI